MRMFFKKIHLWLSIPAGLIIVILCITGAMLSFEIEILELCYPERYFVKEIKSEKIPLADLVPIINRQLTDNEVAAIKIPSDPKRTYTITLSEGFRISAFVDPYSGNVKGIYNFREGFFFKIMSLHRWMMDGSKTWGKYTMGITTLLFVFILISGIIWWVPNTKKRLKKRLSVHTKMGIRRFLHDLHVSVGIYVSLLLLVCSLTGLMWSFDWYRNGVAQIFGVEKKVDSGQNKKSKKKLDVTSWDVAYSNMQQTVPDNYYIMIEDGVMTVLTKDAPHLRATDKYVFESKTGKIEKSVLYADQKSMSKLMTWAYALHVGAFGGILVRILTCFACIIGGTLPLTGYYLFYKKRMRTQ